MSSGKPGTTYQDPRDDLLLELAGRPARVPTEQPDAAQRRRQLVRFGVDVHQAHRTADRGDAGRSCSRRPGRATPTHIAASGRIGPPTKMTCDRAASAFHCGSTLCTGISLGRFSTTPRVPLVAV